MSNMHVLDIDRVLQVLQRRCKSLNVNLKWSRRAPTAMTDGKTITIPAVHAPVTTEAMDKLYGFVIHEAGHHGRAEAFDILKAAQPSDALAAMYNIAEDDGMEREVGTSFLGDGVALGKMNNVILKELSESWAKQAKTWPSQLTEQQVAPLAVCGLGQLSRMEWDGMSTSSRVGYMNNMHPTAKKLLDDLVNEGWVEKFQGTENEHDTWDLAVDLFKRLYPPEDKDQEDKLEQQRADGHAMQEPESSDGEGDKSGVASDGDEESQDGTGDKQDGTGKPKKAEGEVISWKDAVLSEHNEWKAKEDGATPGNIGIDWTDYTSGDVGLMPQHLVNVIDCTTTEHSPEREGRGRHCAAPTSFLPDTTQSRAFGNQIRRYLQSLTRTKVNTERYHGRLDKRSLVKLALPPIDGGEYNKKLFYRMDRSTGKDTCIHVLTDWSGSMQGAKMKHAADASGRLVQVFDRVLRMPVQLAAFTNGRTKCDIGLIKPFHKHSMSPLDIATGFSRFYKFSSANNDADAVMWAYNQLMKRKEERKILIVLSDGAPAGSWAGSSSSNLKHVTRTIEKEGRVELYGVGICSGAVQNYYTNVKVLKDETEINRTLFEIIREGNKR